MEPSIERDLITRKKINNIFGVEPLQNIALRSDYKEHIVVASFDMGFLRRFPKILEKQFTAIVILGGMINGLHCPTLRDSFWKALGILSKTVRLLFWTHWFDQRENPALSKIHTRV